MVAIIAFGMGIDCPDIRQIIHWGVPEDVVICSRREEQVRMDSFLVLFYFMDEVTLEEANEIIMYQHRKCVPECVIIF